MWHGRAARLQQWLQRLRQSVRQAAALAATASHGSRCDCTQPSIPTIFGSDISGDMLVMARNNLERAGIPFEIPLKQIEAQEVKPPTDTPGLLIANPPYGERIDVRGDSTQEPDAMAIAFFSAFGSVLKNRFAGWAVCLFTADLTLPRMLRLKESKKTPFFNGAIECRLFRFEMVAGSNRHR